MTPFGFLVLFVMLSWFLLSVLGYIHMKWKSHDDVKFVAVALYGLYAWDVFSDIFFASDIWSLWRTPDYSLSIYDMFSENAASQILLIFWCLSAFFIIFPFILSFYYLAKAKEEWRSKGQEEIHEEYSNDIIGWLEQNGKYLSFLSFISGSSFAAVELMNSRVFGLNLFCMNLAKKHLDDFNQHRLVSVVFTENIPQLILQVAFTVMIYDDIGSVAMMAMTSSAVSIFAAIMEWSNQKFVEESRSAKPTFFGRFVSFEFLKMLRFW